jgi:RNA polymerase sigma-70 factor (ECF subfamily)
MRKMKAGVILSGYLRDNQDMKVALAVQEMGELTARAMPVDFGNWMLAEQKRIYLLCLRMLRNGDEANSATQDVFVEAHRALERADRKPIDEPAKWLTRVALNTCINRLRSKRWMFWHRQVAGNNEEAVLRFRPATGLNQEDALIARDISRRISQSLHKLSVRQRMVFLLHYDEDYSLEEIAEALNLDTGTVKAHMARAIKKLREELRGLYVR